MKPVGNVSVRRRSAMGLEVKGRAGIMQSSIIGREAALVASSYRPVSHCRHPELIAWEQAWAGEGVNAAAISKPRVFMPQLLADTNVVPLPISRSPTSRVHNWVSLLEVTKTTGI